MDASRKRDSASAQEPKQNWMDSDVRQKIFDPLKEDMLDNLQRQDTVFLEIKNMEKEVRENK